MRFLATTLTTLLILIAVLLPGSKIPDVGFAGIDKLVHFTLFAVWAVSVRRDFASSFRWWWCLVAGVVFSWLTEILQIAAEGRTFDYTDIAADAVGLLFGIMIGKHLLKLLGRYLKI